MLALCLHNHHHHYHHHKFYFKYPTPIPFNCGELAPRGATYKTQENEEPTRRANEDNTRKPGR
ncbi:hypothetical protein K440DRAFT_613465 [Wilcoxina mikolae CBS 423.85]|nr:hypothetical protein K440DRAFT_613465 [Wilcoxina mikolae CBS 423.85]